MHQNQMNSHLPESHLSSKHSQSSEKTRNAETTKLVEKLRQTITTKDALVESLQNSIIKNEKDAKEVNFSDYSDF